jgi:hypothetical protein
MFSTIQTLLNTTKLDMTNMQSHSLTRYTSSSALVAGTPNYVVYNDANGDLTEAAQLPTAQGGLGANLSPSGVSDASKVLSVNAAGNGFQLSSVPQTPGGNIFNYYQFS